MDVPRTPGDVLAQPTRARLFARLVDLRRPASTDELSQELGLHPNGVRTHLERLSDAGLVARGRERRPKGRPRDVWSLSPDVGPGGDRPSAYADLGHWLARSIAEHAPSLPAVEATGREIGRELAAARGSAADEERMHATLVALGFRPARRVEGDTTLTYTLGNCPYRDVVRAHQPVVCALHRGITRGLLDEISPRTELIGFVPNDPDAAGCVIELRGPLADEAAARSQARGIA